jgi:hypothetical protein
MSLGFLFRVLHCVVVRVFFPMEFWTLFLLTCDDVSCRTSEGLFVIRDSVAVACEQTWSE